MVPAIHHEPQRAKLWLASAGLIAVVVFFVTAVSGYRAAVRSVDRSLDVRHAIDAWVLAMRGVEDSARQYEESRTPAAITLFRAGITREHDAQTRLRALVRDDRAELTGVDSAGRAGAALVALYERDFEALARSAGPRSIESTFEQQDLMDVFEDRCLKLQEHEREVLSDRRTRLKLRVVLAMTGGSTLGAIAFGLLLTAWRANARREALLAEAAREARGRLQRLSEVAVALSEVRTKAEVARVVVDIAMQAMSADTSTLYLLDASSDNLDLLGECGVAPGVAQYVQKLTRAQHPTTFETLATGRSVWVENEAEYHRLMPRLKALTVPGKRVKAFWSVPLVVEGRPLGLLGMGYYEPRRFTEDDRQLVDTLSKHCGQALARATRLEGEEEARRWFTTTLKSIGDAVIATDPAGRVTFMNPVAESLTGFEEAAARGRPLEAVFRIYSEQGRTPVESPVAKVLREGKVVGLANHTVLRARNGNEIAIDDSGAPIRSESGELLGVVLVFRDVSREKAEQARREFLAQAGEALVSSLDYQSTLAAVTRLAVPAIADWCAIDILEPGAERPYQAAVAHADPKRLEFARELGERYPPDPDARTGAPQVIRSGQPELYVEIPEALLEAAAVDADHLRLIRELALHSAMVVPLRAREHTLGAITFVYAESRRRYGEDDLAFAQEFARRAAMAIENALAVRTVDRARSEERRLRAEAEIASRAKDEFLAMVSHELRTPLNSILGWAVMLRAGGNDEKLSRGLAVIERNARTQAKLIDDVLDVSRIISGKLALSLGPASIADIIVASIETVAPAAEAKGIAIEATLPSEPVTVVADAQRVQQVIWNLLSNAVKFTPKGGRVRLDARLETSDVVIEVTDTGEGIRREMLESVFEPFQQADVSTTRRHGGLGLGLAIVKQLVQAHGGTVRAHSDGPGTGAKFVVALPARSAAAMSRPLEDAPLAATDGGDGPLLDGLVVLAVDDEQDALQLVSRVLTSRGAEVHAVASARAALDMLATLKPDVIVSDVGMPEEDGYSLIRKVRTMPPERGGRTPAVALTAYARREDAQRAFAAGYQLHVAKPIEPVELARVVANLGGRSAPSA